MISRKFEHKIFVILLCFTIIANAYPYIRFQNNWTNSDFTHLVPQLAYSIQHNTIFAKEAFGNSLFYPIIVIELKTITGSTLPALLMFIIPFSVGILAVISLYVYTRGFVNSPEQKIVAMGFLLTSPIILIVFTSAKHSIFSWSLAFLLLFLINVVERDGRSQFMFLVLFISFSLILFHLYVSGLMFGIIFVYWGLTRGGELLELVRETAQSQPVLLLAFTGIISWLTYYMTTPRVSFKRFINRLVGAAIISQSSNSGTASTPSEAGEAITPSEAGGAITPSEAGGEILNIGIPGTRRFVLLLASRWDPWWLWVPLNISLLIILVLGGLIWLRTSLNTIIFRERLTVTYVWASVVGLVGIIVLKLGLGGYSAQNILFRYFRYFIPVAVVFICSRMDTKQLFADRYRTGLLVLLLSVLLITAPLNLSREMTDNPHRVHSAAEASAVDWHTSYGQSTLTVEDRITFINVQQIYQIEFYNYSFKEDLPITFKPNGRRVLYFQSESHASLRADKLYSSEKARIFCKNKP